MEWRHSLNPPHGHRGIDLGPGVQECHDDPGMTPLGSEVKGRDPAVLVEVSHRVDVASSSKKAFDEVFVALLGSQCKARDSAWTSLVDARTRRQKDLREGVVAIP